MCGSCRCQQVCCQSNVGNSLCDYRIVYIIPKDSLLADGFISCICQQNSDAAPALPAPVKATENQEATENITTTIIETTEITETVTQDEQKTVTQDEHKEEPVVQIQEPEPDIKRIEVKIKGKSEAIVVVFDSNVGTHDTNDAQVFLFKEEAGPDRDVTLGKQLPVTRQEDKSAVSSDRDVTLGEQLPVTRKEDKSAVSSDRDVTLGKQLPVTRKEDKSAVSPVVQSNTKSVSSIAISRLYVSSQPDILKQQKFTGGCIHNKNSCCGDCCPDNKVAVHHKNKKKKKDKQGGLFSQCCSCCRSDKPKNHKGKGKNHKERKHRTLDYNEKSNYEGTRHNRNKHDQSLREKGNNEGINKYDRNRNEGSSNERINVNERSKNEAGRCVCLYSRRNACGCTGSHKHYTDSPLVNSSSKQTSVTSYQTSNSEGSNVAFPRDEYRRK